MTCIHTDTSRNLLHLILPGETDNFGLPIMSIFHYGKNVRFVTCLILEEAGKIMASE